MADPEKGVTAHIDKPLLAVRLLLILVSVPPVYWLVYHSTSTLFWLYGIAWVPHTISLLISVQLAWTIWTRITRLPGRRGN